MNESSTKECEACGASNASVALFCRQCGESFYGEHDRPVVHDVLYTRNLVVTDKSGKARAALGCIEDDGRVSLIVWDQAGETRFEVRAEEDHIRLGLTGKNGKPRVILGCSDSEEDSACAYLTLYGKNGEPRAGLICDESEAGTALRLIDKLSSKQISLSAPTYGVHLLMETPDGGKVVGATLEEI